MGIYKQCILESAIGGIKPGGLLERPKSAIESFLQEDEDMKQRGISILPDNCMAWQEGYRYGAYEEDEKVKRVVDFFRTHEEIQAFVNEHPEFGRQQKAQ